MLWIHLNVFFRDIERAKQYDAIINDLPYGKIGELVSQSGTHLLKVHEADCWRDKNAPCEKFPNKTRDYIDKFEGFKNNQIKNFIFMLLTVTEDLDYPREVLLLEVIFLIKDLFSITSEETKQYMLDGDIAYDRRTVSNFPGKGW